MHIPSKGLERFVREVADHCLTSQTERINRGMVFTNYAGLGSQNPNDAAFFNKTFAYLDDLESLLYSPINLRFHIGDPDIPNVVSIAKGRSAAARLRHLARQSETDTSISDAVGQSLVKGKAFIKMMYKGNEFSPTVVAPETMGVMRENHGKLDSDMEAFVHSMLITPYQFERIVANHRDRDFLIRKARGYGKLSKGGMSPADGAMKQVIVGGLYPFQANGVGTPNSTRGIVDWMGGPSPSLSPAIANSLMQLDEVWVWDDDRGDWATFQIVGDLLIAGKFFICNALAWNPDTSQEEPGLKGKHPFTEFCANRSKDYFWGRSEILNVALLQEAINARINGMNKMLRMQEDPPKKFVGSTGVNQAALSRFSKPGGYWTDSNPNAKIDSMPITIPQDAWTSLHEYERMFDEMGGLPPIARGKGDAGVRSHAHAETLVRMFSPRFKDRALLVERDVESLGGLMLDLGRAHIAKKLIAWVPEAHAGLEKDVYYKSMAPLLIPPAKGLVPVWFTFDDLDEDVILTIDSHSSSPAFSAESKSLAFDLLKIGAMSPEEVVDHVDAPDPEELAAGIKRRAIDHQEQAEKQEAMKLIAGGKHK